MFLVHGDPFLLDPLQQIRVLGNHVQHGCPVFHEFDHFPCKPFRWNRENFIVGPFILQTGNDFVAPIDFDELGARIIRFFHN